MKIRNPKNIERLFWDERTWQVLPHPPNNLQSDNQVEVFRPIEMFGWYYLFFSLALKNDSSYCKQTRRSRIGVYYISVNSSEGPFSKPEFLVARSLENADRIIVLNYQGELILRFQGSSMEVLTLAADEAGKLCALPLYEKL